MSELLRRRVPQIVGAYLLAGWGVVQFAQFIEARYQLTHHLVEFAGILWLLLLPSVALLSYGHGAPGADRVRRVEKLGVPLNLLLAATILIFAFHGRSFGSVVRTVEVVDEDGKARERMVPKGDFLRRIMLFPLASADGNLLGDAVSQALFYDLLQDPVLVVGEPFSRAELLERFGAKDGHGLSAASKRRVAEELHRDWWIDGEVGADPANLSVRLALHHVTADSPVAELSAQGELFEVVDELSARLKESLDLPRSYLQQSEDKPVTEIFCAKGAALLAFVEAQRALSLRNEYGVAIERLENAVDIEPSFCTAWFTLFATQSYANDTAGAEDSIQKAMQHIYRVPERFAFQIKMSYFMNVRPDGERAMRVGEMWAEVYPQDVAAQLTLAALHTLREEKDEALLCYRRALQIDPKERSALTAVAEILQAKQDHAGAEAALQSYASSYPEETRPFEALASLYLRIGKLPLARESLERAVLLDPTKPTVQLMLAQLDAREGRFDEARASLVHLLEDLPPNRDRLAVLAELERLERRIGRLEAAMSWRSQLFGEAHGVLSPTEVVLQQLFSFETPREAGRIEMYERELEELTPQLSGQMSGFADGAYALLSAIQGDEVTTLKRLQSIQTLIDQTGLRVLENILFNVKAVLYEQTGDFEMALAQCEGKERLQGPSLSTCVDSGRLLLALARHESAVARLEQALSISPADGEANLTLALVGEAQGASDLAREHLERALRSWSQADPGFARREQALALQGRLDSTP